MTDDGLPSPPGLITTTWSMVSGPGSGIVTFDDAAAVDTTATFSERGTYVLRLTADDSTGPVSDDITITVTGPDGEVAFEVRINNSTDDAEERQSGNITLANRDLEMVFDKNGDQTVGLRFNGVDIPPGANITTAHVQFTVDETPSGPTTLTIEGEDTVNAATFTNTDFSISARPRTAASVPWLPAPWLTVGAAGPDQQTADISAIIQEIVDQPGWASGNALAIIISGTGERVAESYNGSQPDAPLLRVTYTFNLPPNVDAGADQSVTLPASAMLDGTVSDDGQPNPPGVVTTTWSKVSGSGIVTFTDATAVDTTASFSEGGTYVLRLMANDNHLSASDDVTVTVTAANVAPTVMAGTNQTITLPANAILDGTVTDDGLPNPPATVTTTWSVVSGPGTVTFANVAAVDTTATFSLDGTYVLRLTADDGEFTASDDITVTVNPIPNQAPTVEAGANQTTSLPSASVNLDGTVTDDGLPNPPATVTTTWSVVSGPDVVTFGDAAAVDTAASFVTDGVYILRLTADDSNLTASDEVTITVTPENQPPTVSAGLDQTITLPDSALLDGTVTDDGWPSGTLTTTWSVVSGTGSVAFADAAAVDTTASFSGAGTYVLRLTADDSELTASDDLTITVNPAPNQTPIVDAGANQIVNLPDLANLNGTVSDDNLPNPPATITTTWSVVSGTGSVTFADAAAVDTTADFSIAGTYVLRLTADDSELTASDEVTITVTPPNQPPTVDAGLNQTIVLTDTVALDGTVADDGLPTPTVTTTWSMVTGTGNITFGDTTAVDTTATFSDVGVYVLRLTADDGLLTASDEVTVTVDPPTNQPPVVDAGPDAAVNLPNALQLQGSVSDDGWPNPPATVTTTWSVVSGTGSVTFADAAAVDTTASFSIEGVYVLRLTADDSELNVTDTVTITVNPQFQLPQITSFTPISGPVATSVIIDGSHFSGTISVTFNGVAASNFTIVSDNQIQVYVPSGATTGQIVVTNIGGSGNSGTSYTVTAHPPVLVGAGDIADCLVTEDEETALLLDTIPGTVVVLGDSVYPDGSAADFTNCYDPTWGRHKDRTSPAPGNHEYQTTNATGYYNYFGAAAGDPSQGYYSYDIEGWHIIVLNSECDEIGGCERTSSQGQWLEADLAANPAICTLAYFHHPLFSSGSKATSQTYDLWDILYDAGTEVVLNGHEHFYERFAQQDPDGNADPGRGIRSFIAGTGGREVEGFDVIHPNSEVRNGQDFGVLKLTLNPTSYDWEFVPIAGQTFTDSGTTSCYTNLPPTVDAGADQSLNNLVDPAVLDGTVTDDGLPNPPGVLSTTWSMVSGPGSVTFANANMVDTTATFSVPGAYVLRLTVSDNDMVRSDDVTITVATAGIITLDARVSANSDDAEESAVGSVNVNNGDLEMVFDDGGNQTVGLRFNDINIPNNAVIVDAYLQFKADEKHSGVTNLIIEAEDVDHAFTFNDVSGDISSRPRTAAAVAWTPDPWTTVGEIGLPQRTPNIASVIQEVVNRSGWVYGNSLAVIITGTGERVAESHNADPPGAPLLHIEYYVSGQQRPNVAAGPDQSISMGAGALLDGSVSDDGLPNPPGVLATNWSLISGPGTVTFVDANAVDTTATFSAIGTYTLRLTADDSELTASDEVEITVMSNQSAPTVDAGPDQAISILNPATLDGTVADDGLPNPPGALTTTWSVVSGPGTVTFTDAAAVDTTATFSTIGTYVLRLTADDSELTASDEVTMTVTGAGGETIIEIQVEANTDDAEEGALGDISLNSSDLELVFDDVNQTVGVRFINVDIPQGATVTNAYVQFMADETATVATSLTIQGEATDNALTFDNVDFNISSRPTTAASVAWSPPAWQTIGEAGPDQRTSDISAVIQEIVDRPGWTNNNSMVIIITGSGERTAESLQW